MDISFLTLPCYDGKIIKPTQHRPATGGAAGYAWEEDASEGPYHPIFKKVREILANRGEKVTHLARLKYDDLTGFGNSLYRIDGSKHPYFLKILGDKQGNRREIFAWKILGYGKDGSRIDAAKSWIKGLPAEVFAMAPLNAILTRYYPGQIHTIRGGAYEFPLVMAVVLYLDETLSGMHEHGLMFMDLCPDNILYLEDDPNRPMLFFLTDMGSVKAITGREGQDENWVQLRDLVTPDRWTRAEARPPEELFPQPNLQITEDNPGYDDHTLARTAVLLMGFGQRYQIEDLDLSGYPQAFNIEQPFSPTRSEMTAFLQLLRRPLRGEKVDRAKLSHLFRQFFLERATFAAEFIDEPAMRKAWRNNLLQRLTRYKMVLSAEEKRTLPERLEQIFAANRNSASNSLNRDFTDLANISVYLRLGELEKAVDLLARLAASRLPDLCPTAGYALSYHAKLARALGRQKGQAIASERLAFSDDLREQIPEIETLTALRQGQVTQFGTLIRRIGL